MSSIELKRLARRIARLEQGQANMSKPQLAYSSIENGNIKSYEGDNLKMSIGLQDDGSSTMRFFDGPVPPVPAGFTALADGPLIQGTWDGTFQDGVPATYDLAYLEVAATLVDDDSRVSFATITAKEGASASVVANQSGLWAVAVRSVSQAGKKSEFASAGTVEVKLVDLAGAIEAVQDSANGKNKVTYSSHAPTENDPGIFDDTWFVGQVGRPEDIIEATNLAENPSFEIDTSGWEARDYGYAVDVVTTDEFAGQMGGMVGGKLLQATAQGSGYTWIAAQTTTPVTPGQWLAVRSWLATDQDAVRAAFLFETSSGTQVSVTTGATVAAPLYGGAFVEHSWLVPDTAAQVKVILQANKGSGILAGARLWVDQVFVAEAASQADALSAVQDYFDGDTPSGATNNESHYRWTGTPHASTSEKYLPALDIGESSNWNIIEQYRHDGNGWVKVELSHMVFSTVDLGKATVGELDGIRIMAETVGAEQLRADFADFMVARGATLIAGNDRHRLDDSGYALFDDNGDRRTFLSPGGSTFKGEVEAETLVVNDGAEFKGNNTLAQGARLTLAAGVTDPTAPPVVQPYWGGVEFTPPTLVSGSLVGLAFDGTNYWTTAGSWYEAALPHNQIFRVDGSTGAVTGFQFPVSGSNERFGVTCIGSELFWLYRKDYQAFVVVTDLNCVKKREWEYPVLGYSSTNPLTYKPAIGNDGTNIVTAQCTDAGRATWRVWNKTTGAQISYTEEGNDNAKTDFTGVHIGAADWGGTFVTLAKKKSSEVVTFDTSGVYDGAKTFNAVSPNSTGVVFHDGKFHTLDPAGVIHEYADSNTGDGSGDWWATYYWYTDVDGDNIIGSSDYRSRMSPPARFTWPRRAMLKILGQPMPEGVGALGPALAKKTSTPTRTDFHGPPWQVDTGKPSARYTSLPTNWATAYSSPSDTNTFPEATSSVLESASGTFQVKGDGSGHWGPLTMGLDGIMSGLIVTGWMTCYVDNVNNAKKFTVQLPPGRFSKPPVVWASVSTSGPQLCSVGIVREEISATEFSLWFHRTSLTNTGVTWYAMDDSEA